MTKEYSAFIMYDTAFQYGIKNQNFTKCFAHGFAMSLPDIDEDNATELALKHETKPLPDCLSGIWKDYYKIHREFPNEYFNRDPKSVLHEESFKRAVMLLDVAATAGNEKLFRHMWYIVGPAKHCPEVYTKALVSACDAGNLNMVVSLLSAGARDPHSKAWDAATRNGKKEILSKLETVRDCKE